MDVRRSATTLLIAAVFIVAASSPLTAAQPSVAPAPPRPVVVASLCPSAARPLPAMSMADGSHAPAPSDALSDGSTGELSETHEAPDLEALLPDAVAGIRALKSSTVRSLDSDDEPFGLLNRRLLLESVGLERSVERRAVADLGPLGLISVERVDGVSGPRLLAEEGEYLQVLADIGGPFEGVDQSFRPMCGVWHMHGREILVYAIGDGERDEDDLPSDLASATWLEDDVLFTAISGWLDSLEILLLGLRPRGEADSPGPAAELHLRDEVGDVKELGGVELGGPGFIDLTGAGISTADRGIEVWFDVATPIPEAPEVGTSYSLQVDLHGDDARDMTFSIGYLRDYDPRADPRWRGMVLEESSDTLTWHEVTVADARLSLVVPDWPPGALADARIRAEAQTMGDETVETVFGEQRRMWIDRVGKGPMRARSDDEEQRWPPPLPGRTGERPSLLLDVEALRESGSREVEIDVISDALLDHLAEHPRISDVLAFEYALQGTDFEACEEELQDDHIPFESSGTEPWTEDAFTLSRCLRAFAALHATAVLSGDGSIHEHLEDFVGTTAARYPAESRTRYLGALQAWVDLVMADRDGT